MFNSVNRLLYRDSTMAGTGILNAVMDVPEKMAPYVLTFKTLFLNVKNIDTEELTPTDHPFARLMTVLQKKLRAI